MPSSSSTREGPVAEQTAPATPAPAAGRERDALPGRLAAWIAALIAIGTLFEVFDLHAGIARAGIVAALALLVFVVPRELATAPGRALPRLGSLVAILLAFVVLQWLVAPPQSVRLTTVCELPVILALLAFVPWRLATRGREAALRPRWLVALLVFCALTDLGLAAARYAAARSDTGDLGDEERSNYAGAVLLARGQFPWSTGSVVDADLYIFAARVVAQHGCLTVPTDALETHVAQYTVDLRPEQGQWLESAVRDEPRCREIVRAFRAAPTGLKYGAAMVATYLPLAVLLGPTSIRVTNLVLLIALAWLVARGAGGTDARRRLPALVALPILVAPPALARTTLGAADCDIVPTVFAVAALYALDRGRERTAAVWIATSIAAKLLPGVLLLPLLSRSKRSALLWFAAALTAWFVPILLWNPRGVAANLFLFMFTRLADSTSIAYYLPAFAGRLLRIVGVALIALAALRGHRRGRSSRDRLEYVIAAQLAVFATANVLHTNYVGWLLPVLGLYTARVVRGDADAAVLPAGAPLA